MSEDIIEDITEEALLEDQELVQDTAEEVTEQQSYSDAIKSILLGESKSSKKESEDEDEDEEEMEEGYKKKMESEDEDEESEDEEEMEEAAKPPTATGDATTAVIVKDAEAEAAVTAADIKKSTKAGEQPKAVGDAKSVKPTDETDSIKSVNKASHTGASAKTEDLDLLISAEANLTEDFKAKASILFEAAVSQKIVAEKARLEEEYEQNLIEEVTEIRESLINKIDDYLNYVVESYIEENQIQVDSKLRTEIAEDFMGSLKNLFVESYIEVPESKTDLFDELESENAAIKESLELAEAEALALSEKVELLLREKILSEQTEDLTSTQIEKMKALTEEVEFVSEEAFAEKVTTIKSSVFSSGASQEIFEDTDSETEVIVEGEVGINQNISSDMKKYLSALTRIKENNPHGK